MLVVALRFAVVIGALGFLIRPLPRANLVRTILTLLLVGPLHFGIQYSGLHLARDLSPMVIAMQLWIPCSVVFAGLILRERVGPLKVAGVALAFLGIVAMAFDPIVFAQLGALALVALAAACHGIGAVLVRKQGQAMDPWSMQAWIALLAVPVMGTGSALFERHQIEAMAHASWAIWGFILFGAIVSSIVANAFMFQLVQRYEVARVTPFMLMTPVISFVLAGLVLGDHVSLRVALGAAITLAGVALAALAEQRFRPGVTVEP
jgi:O-acetylserine/cysteine efflux transporter